MKINKPLDLETEMRKLCEEVEDPFRKTAVAIAFVAGFNLMGSNIEANPKTEETAEVLKQDEASVEMLLAYVKEIKETMNKGVLHA